MKTSTQIIFNKFFQYHPDLLPIQDSIMKTAALWITVLGNGGKLLLCGNGGSCADCDHIVGELMKGFQSKRPLCQELKDSLSLFGDFGKNIGEKLQQGLPAISLCAHSAAVSAFANDVDGELIYAQQVTAYGNSGDILVGISTSGNSRNVIAAMMLAKAKGLHTIALTGGHGGSLAALADISIIAPSEETYRIQEYHLPIYHLLCALVENELFET